MQPASLLTQSLDFLAPRPLVTLITAVNPALSCQSVSTRSNSQIAEYALKTLHWRVPLGMFGGILSYSESLVYFSKVKRRHLKKKWRRETRIHKYTCKNYFFKWHIQIIGNESSSVAQLFKNPLANAGDTKDESLIPGWGRSPGEAKGNPLQYFCLGNPMNRGAW